MDSSAPSLWIALSVARIPGDRRCLPPFGCRDDPDVGSFSRAAFKLAVSPPAAS